MGCRAVRAATQSEPTASQGVTTASARRPYARPPAPPPRRRRSVLPRWVRTRSRPASSGPGGGEHQDLPYLDAQVEAEQRACDRALEEAAEIVGEAGAVDQPEDTGEQGAITAQAPCDVLESCRHDRHRDEKLDQRGREPHGAAHREGEGDRVPHRECAHDPERVAPVAPSIDGGERDEEQEMVERREIRDVPKSQGDEGNDVAHSDSSRAWTARGCVGCQ